MPRHHRGSPAIYVSFDAVVKPDHGEALITVHALLFLISAFPACAAGEFRCANEQCVPDSARCDGKPDCLDRTDEDGCGTFCVRIGVCVVGMVGELWEWWVSCGNGGGVVGVVGEL